MDLASILSGGKSSKKEYYWALVIETGWIQAGVWEIENEKAKIISTSPPAPWETDEEIIGAADTALSSAVQKLPEDIGEPSKTVFGVQPSWVNEGQIKAEFLERIKRICSELSLEPTGFVVIPEALAHLVKSEEGAPLNAVVIGIGDENIEIAVFKLGNLVGNSIVARSVSISDDVVEGLTRFTGADTLPSRILLYDGKEGELEEERQTLLKISWSDYEKVKFLHTPKIEIVNPSKKVYATALAGASEIANVNAVEPEKPGPVEETISQEVENVSVPEKEISPEDLGFTVGEDVSQKEVIKPVPTAPVPTTAPAVTPRKFSDILSSFGQKILALLPKKSSQPISLPVPNKNIFLYGIIITVALFVIAFILWWYLPKATIMIFVNPKNLDENISLTLDPKASSVDFAKGIIPAEVATTNVNGDKTKSTTGVKLIGEKAKGSAKIQNGTAANINLTSGVILASTSDLKFSVTSGASVSAALSPSQPGTATVEVAAVDIGAQYNLAKDESFKVGNYPKAEVDAVAIENFSGGSSREISAVSAEDQKKLEEELIAELTDKAKEKLQASIAEDKYLIEETITIVTNEKSFSGKVGDEASTLKLSLDLGVSALVIDKKVLFDFASESLKEKVPSGYVLRDNQISYAFEVVSSKSGVYEVEMTLGVNLLPELNIDEITRQIAGKYPDIAESSLTSIPGFGRAEIKIKPTFPGKLYIIPKVIKHISIEVSSGI